MCGSIAITAGNVLCGFDGQTHPFLLSSHCVISQISKQWQQEQTYSICHLAYKNADNEFERK
jgi:hypothetical protein